MLRRFGAPFWFVLFGMALAAPAEAQIYSWRDADGTLVLSGRPPDSGTPMRTFSVAGAQAIRATRPAAAQMRASYDESIERYARMYGVRPALVRAVIQVESGFDPLAVSPKGAMGLMQLMPETAASLGVSNPFNPDQNIRGGVAYLSQLLARYKDNEALALAAYNAGPDAVDRHGTRIPPYPETRRYVSKVQGAPTDPAAVPPPRPIFLSVEVIDGRPVPRYSDTRPASGAYQVLLPR